MAGGRASRHTLGGRSGRDSRRHPFPVGSLRGRVATRVLTAAAGAGVRRVRGRGHGDRRHDARWAERGRYGGDGLFRRGGRARVSVLWCSCLMLDSFLGGGMKGMDGWIGAFDECETTTWVC